MSELQEQEMLCNYIDVNYPEILPISTLNGFKLPMGLAMKAARINKKRGIPDLIILEPKGDYHGLIIELKRTGEKIYKQNGELYENDHLKEQDKILEHLRSRMYYAQFCIGFEEARDVLNKYMNGEV